MNKLPILLNEYEISFWAYLYCKKINNEPEIREFITHSHMAYWYCISVKDDPEIRKNITEKVYINLYNKRKQMLSK